VPNAVSATNKTCQSVRAKPPLSRFEDPCRDRLFDTRLTTITIKKRSPTYAVHLSFIRSARLIRACRSARYFSVMTAGTKPSIECLRAAIPLVGLVGGPEVTPPVFAPPVVSFLGIGDAVLLDSNWTPRTAGKSATIRSTWTRSGSDS